MYSKCSGATYQFEILGFKEGEAIVSNCCAFDRCTPLEGNENVNEENEKNILMSGNEYDRVCKLFFNTKGTFSQLLHE